MHAAAAVPVAAIDVLRIVSQHLEPLKAAARAHDTASKYSFQSAAACLTLQSMLRQNFCTGTGTTMHLQLDLT